MKAILTKLLSILTFDNCIGKGANLLLLVIKIKQNSMDFYETERKMKGKMCI